MPEEPVEIKPGQIWKSKTGGRSIRIVKLLAYGDERALTSWQVEYLPEDES